MEARERQKLNELRSQVKCAKNFYCVSSRFNKLCSARYRWETNELECLEDRNGPCDLGISREERVMCGCALRIYIEKNLDRWVEMSSAY